MNPLQRTETRSTWQIFRWPLLVNSICLVGLLAALLGNGWLDALSWLCLGSIVILIYRAYSLKSV